MGCKITNFIVSYKGKKLKKNCSNCKECWVMNQISEDLRDLYDWGNNSVFFRRCGKAFIEEENTYCFSEYYAKQINWKAMQFQYEKEKKEMDKYLNEYRKSLKQSSK